MIRRPSSFGGFRGCAEPKHTPGALPAIVDTFRKRGLSLFPQRDSPLFRTGVVECTSSAGALPSNGRGYSIGAASERPSHDRINGPFWWIGHVFRTTNGGLTWTNITANLPDVPTFTIALDPRFGPTTLYVGNDAGVYASTNLGASWSRFGVGLPNAQVHELQLSTDLGILAAGTYGRGMWQIIVNGPASAAFPPTNLFASASTVPILFSTADGQLLGPAPVALAPTRVDLLFATLPAETRQANPVEMDDNQVAVNHRALGLSQGTLHSGDLVPAGLDPLGQL